MAENTNERMLQESKQFQTYLENQTKLSGTTPDNYASHIKILDRPVDLTNFTGENGDQKLDNFLNTLDDRISSAPVKSAIRHYIKWKKKDQNISISERKLVSFITEEISNMSVTSGSDLTESKVKKRVLTDNQVQKIVNYIEEELDSGDFDGNDRWHDEMKLVPLMIYESGCRVGELIGKQNKQSETGLRLRDLNREEKTFEIFNAKGEKDREASYKSNMLHHFIDKYDIEDPNEKIFTIKYSKLWYRLKVVGKDVLGRGKRKGEKPLKTHDFRHTFATNWAKELLDNGLSYYEALEKVEDYFDHEDQETTEIYVHVAQQSLEEGNIYASGEKDSNVDIEVDF